MQESTNVRLVLATATALSIAASPASAPSLRADLARHFFASVAAEREDRARLFAALGALRRFQGQLASSGQSLFEALRAQDEVLRLERRHLAYLRLRCAIDRSDRTSCADEDELESRVSAETAFLATEIARIPEPDLAALMRAEPRLGDYRFALVQVRRASAHALDAPREELLDRLRPSLMGWQFPLYQEILGGIRFGTVSTPSGELDARRDRTRIAVSPDRTAREKGFRLFWQGLASRRELLAFALLQTVRARNEIARLRGFADAPAQHDFEMSFEPGQTRKVLDDIGVHGELLKRYERVRGADLRPLLRRAAPAPWDMAVPPLDLNPISLEDARGILHRAFAGLGETYRKEFDDLLDPSSGRADIGTGGEPKRALSGFSVGFPGTTSVLFVGNFQGTFKDLSVVAHEGGHAAHRGLMNAHQVGPLHADGPSFVFESFAMFNELLLADWMAAHAPSPALARYYREQFLSIKGLDFLRGADDGALEQAIYDGVSTGAIRGAEDLDRLTLQIDGAFSIWPAQHPELRERWAALTLAYEDPLYDVNYMYAGLLALQYFHLYETRREWFVPRYRAMLENGFDATPAQLLRRFLEIDLSVPKLIEDAVRILDRRLEELER